MIKKLKTNESIQYQKLSPEEMKARGILGRLVGPCADFINPTRNGRKYSEQLWENVFNNPLMQEKIKNGVCYGELGHPEDRTETNIEKIAICLREQPVKNDKGQLVAVFDILDTPCGRILKTLCDYGSKLGISSRGQGDLVTDYNGDESVDPDTYECECWDVVLVPGVETARLDYMTESLNTKNKKLKIALKESLNESAKEKYKAVISWSGIFCGDKRSYKNDITYVFDHEPTEQEIIDRFENDEKIVRLKNWNVNNVRKEVKDFMNGAYANNDGWEDLKITSYKIIKEVTKSLDITSSSVDESLKEYW